MKESDICVLRRIAIKNEKSGDKSLAMPEDIET